MARKRARIVKDFDELPQVIKWYLRALEGWVGADDLKVLLRDDVRWTRDGKKWIEGRDLVLQHILGWRDTVQSCKLEIARMEDYDDGTVKVDFYLHIISSDGSQSAAAVRIGVMGMYFFADQKISEICEYWQAVPPGARLYQ